MLLNMSQYIVQNDSSNAIKVVTKLRKKLKQIQLSNVGSKGPHCGEKEFSGATRVLAASEVNGATGANRVLGASRDL